MIKEPYEKDCCLSREMTVIETLNESKSILIQDLAALDKALIELSNRNVSNDTLKAVIKNS